MRPVTSNTITSVAASNPIVVDYRGNQSRIGVQVTIGVGTYTVQMTNDDVFADGYVAASGNWFSVPAASLVAATTAQMAEVTCPCTALRLNVTAYTSGNFIMRVVDVSGSVA